MTLRARAGVAAAAVVLSAAAAPLPQSAPPQTPSPPATAAPAAGCEVSTDPDFALTPQKAMRVGGGAMYVAARERRYLEGLRGPAGQALTARRVGTTMARTNGSPIDHWQVSYEGLAKPIGIYLDAYSYEEPKAPVGFTCVPFALGPPPVDGFLASRLLVQLAIEEAASTSDLAPVPLSPDGSTAHGVAFDRFRVMVRTAKAAVAAGQKLDPESPPRELMFPGMVLVAYPLKCGDRTVTPTGVEIVPAQGPVIRSQAPPVSGDGLRSLLPGGFTAPEGAIAITTQLGLLRPGDSVRIAYGAEVCDGAMKDVLLRPAHASARPLDMPQPAAPPDVKVPLAPVWLQVVIDHEGRLRSPSLIGGPEALRDAAIKAIAGWRAEPARVNGAPVTSDTLVLVNFK